MLPTSISTYFQQFTFLAAIRLLLVRAIKALLDPYSGFSYGQTGEDRILLSMFHQKRDGFYVDVGCHHPSRISNTFALYQRGWRGINIDANQELIRKFNSLRPKDTNVCAVVSDSEGDATFTDFEEAAVSSLSKTHVETYESTFQIKGTRQVRTIPLGTLLAGLDVPKRFDLLSVDVEGHDLEVISTLNFDIYRPKLILIEIHDFDILNPKQNPIYQKLTSNDYTLVGYVVMNAFFTDTRS